MKFFLGDAASTQQDAQTMQTASIVVSASATAATGMLATASAIMGAAAIAGTALQTIPVFGTVAGAVIVVAAAIVDGVLTIVASSKAQRAKERAADYNKGYEDIMQAFSKDNIPYGALKENAI